MSLDEFKVWLEAQGFRTGHNHLRSEHNDCSWYAWRRSILAARECETNGDKCQIVVRPYSTMFQERRHESVEVELCGEAAGSWWKLMAYSLHLDDACARMPQIEVSLVAAWNSLAVKELA